MFLNEGSIFSFRKLFAFTAINMFIVDCIINWVTFGTLAAAHYSIIGGVAAFYFGKTLINNLKVTNKDENK
jgi:hypothetical protein